MKKMMIGAAVLVLCLCQGGCGINREALENRAALPAPAIGGDPPDNRTQRGQTLDQSQTDKRTKELTEAMDQSNLSAEAQAQLIAVGVEAIPEIEAAYVVVTGKTAIVGIRIYGELNDARVIEIKNIVDREVKEIDPSIAHVAVTASPNLVARILKMIGGKQTPEEEAVLEEGSPNELFYQAAPTI